MAEDIKPEIVYEEKILAPILKGQVIGTIKYNVDEIEYTSELIAGSDVEHSMISIYLIIIGGILLVFSIVIMPKNKKNKYKLK